MFGSSSLSPRNYATEHCVTFSLHLLAGFLELSPQADELVIRTREGGREALSAVGEQAGFVVGFL